eukprot:CAMPEP_0181169110 /NCGR_PEP_ID=MMETSP1096-20121128/637_1 /TAXON_ID=156174 ORGANISM="Chrysochromulina ericina, Strain CCMP281" /NCGR_SAMPLE_ID=MMETSP1096 /ASSEMBLY_ACC=CAM_ASM_000453 /LENGTH=307 /DNA_ID=CAMNT_0023256541 /DNA_START=174 /DNA_END=1097 /DNA_ORIENTATION=-
MSSPMLRHAMKTDPEFTLPPRSELDKLPYGHVYARMADGMWFPANGTYSTGAVTDLHGALHMLQEKLLPIVTQEGKGTWEDYALQFPVNTEDTITFDFDPTYMTGAYSRATFASIVHTVPGAKMLAVLRDPSELACRRVILRASISEHGALRSCIDLMAREPNSNSVDHDCNALALHAHRLHTYCYAEHVAEWQKHFKPPNVMLLKAEELKDPKNRASMVNGVFSWLGLPTLSPHKWDALDQEHNPESTGHHAASKYPNDHAYCIRRHRQTGSYLSKCNDALVKLTDDTRWHWWTPRYMSPIDELRI